VRAEVRAARAPTAAAPVLPPTAATTAWRPPTEDRSPSPHLETEQQQQLDLVTVPARQGLEAVDIMRRGARPAVGPVLHDTPGHTLGFLVPPGTAEEWNVPGSACTTTFGRGLRIDPADLEPGLSAPPAPPPVDGTCWLLPPDSPGQVTDPATLRAALGEAARLIEAADRCR
jgi:hypothetical protein